MNYIYPFHSVLQCHRCEGMESEDMFYHNGELHPLLSEHPDIKKAWKAWDEIIFLWEEQVNGDVLQCQNNSNSESKGGEDTILPEDSGNLDAHSHAKTDSISAKDSTNSKTAIEETEQMEERENVGRDDIR